MNSFTISDAFSFGWRKMKENFWASVIILVVYGVISLALGQVSNEAKSHGVFNLLAFLLSLVVGVFIRIGFLRYFLVASEGKAGLKEFFTMGSVYFTFFVAYVVLGALTAVGFVLLIVPGVYVAVTFLFVPTLIIDRDMGVIESFEESAVMTKGHKWYLFGFLVLCILLNVVGFAAFIVGLFVTIPVTFFAGIYAYRRLLNNELPAVEADVVPPSTPSEN